jgi:CrcB protein
MRKLLLVSLGGALGSGARYLVAAWATEAFGPAFPRGTLLVNVAGSFLIAVILGVSLRMPAISPDVRVFLTTGVMGGFTTYSAFSYETVSLMERGASGPAWLNLVLTTSGCLAVCYLGMLTGRMVLAPR